MNVLVLTEIKNGKKKTIVFNVLIERDLNAGLMGMTIDNGYGTRNLNCVFLSQIYSGEGLF